MIYILLVPLHEMYVTADVANKIKEVLLPCEALFFIVSYSRIRICFSLGDGSRENPVFISPTS